MGETRVVVLGGAGDMGSRVARELARSGEVQLVVADLRAEKAEALAAELGPGVTACPVDATDRDSLLRALRDAAVAVNCIGPFYRYAEGILHAAIAAGVSYVDICDDDDATLRLLALDGLARRRGITALIGIGWTPGVSNLLARRAWERLDAVDSIDITWVGSAADSEGEAVIKHVIHAVAREVPIYRDHRWTRVAALSGIREVEFPPPIGRVPAYFCGHPEPITLPRFLDGVGDVTVRGYLLPAEIQRLTRALIDLDLASTERKIDGLAGLLQPFLPVLAHLGGKPAPPVSGVRVDARGTRAGRAAAVSYCAIDTMERLTGIPPAVAALMLARGDLAGKGVLAPEGCLPTEPFFAELARRQIEVEEVP